MNREEFIKKYEDAVEIQGAWAGGAVIADYIDSKLGQPVELQVEEACGVPDACDHGYITMTPSDYEIEIARRVAEDRRDALCHCQKKLKEARAERDAARAEVERLKKLDEPENDNTPLEHPAYRRGDDHGVSVGEFCRKQLQERIAELEARVAEQCSEIERLSRPCDGPQSPECNCYIARRERNAREAAEKKLETIRVEAMNSTVSPTERLGHIQDLFINTRGN